MAPDDDVDDGSGVDHMTMMMIIMIQIVTGAQVMVSNDHDGDDDGGGVDQINMMTMMMLTMNMITIRTGILKMPKNNNVTLNC